MAQGTLEYPLFSTHPLVLLAPHVRLSAAARLQVNEQTVGSLCAYDLKPRNISEADVRQLQLLAASVVELLLQRLPKDS